MHNATFLAHHNELLRAANAKQTANRAKSSKKLRFAKGVAIGEDSKPVETPDQAPKGQMGEGDKPAETGSLARQRAPPRCTNCFELGHRRNQYKLPTS